MKKLTGVLMLTLMPMSAWAQRAGEFFSDFEYDGGGGSLSFGAGAFIVIALAALWWFFSEPGSFLIARFPWLFMLVVILAPMGVVVLSAWLF